MLATNPKRRSKLRVLAPSLAATFLIGLMSGAHAQTAPLAGNTIGNRASATYSDGSGISRTVTSNEVVTTVQQIAAVSLVASRNEIAAPGAPVVFSHTVTNAGNGTDSFNLAAVLASGALNNIKIYADVNGDGVPDNNVEISQTPSLAPGASFNFVVVAENPVAAVSGSTATLTVTATSVFTPGISASNTDSVTTSPNAVINLSKGIDQTSGPAGGTRTYTLTYTNSGSTSSGPLTVTDNLPANVTYVAGTGRWSNSGGTALTDASTTTPDPTDPAGITYTNNGTTLTAVIPSVPRGDTGRITFQVTINANAPRGNIVNFANALYDDDNDPDTAPKPDRSNDAIYTVNQTAALTFVGPASPTANTNPGQPISFNNVLTNNGNGPDSFDVVVGSSTFPDGTTFELFKTDGVTPLTDTNGNSVPDTGTLSVGGTYTVVLRVTVPTTSTPLANGPYSVSKTATSFLNPTVSATATDTLTTITPTSVDLTNGGALGVGSFVDVVILSVSGNPGTTVTIPLTVSNAGGVADSYALTFSKTSVFSPTSPLPLGYTVVFRDANTGAVVTNTGIINGGAAKDFIAQVFIPAGTPAGAQDIYFRAFSPTSNTGDIIRDAINVNAVNAISVEPNQSGQIYQGGSVVYAHTISNDGNAPLTNVTVSAVDSAAGFVSVVYLDANGDGILSAAEVAAGPISPITSIPAGGSVSVIVQVFAPLGATPSTTNITTVTASGTNGAATVSDSAIDTTKVVEGALSIEKFQSTDNITFTKANLSALPNARIYYRIVVRNTGATPVNGVVISDGTPTSTRYFAGNGTTTGPNNAAAFTKDGGTTYSAGSAPGNGSAGLVTFSVGTLLPGQTATATFSVRIDGPAVAS